ncbi:uncharacterized protein LOC111404967 [Olea europaea var. sylvestris]|uniref:uncharacterized protein LOC111404967 n=1 Tax=Olea europaea var. sylvestris TaxID=158386 RepID=UPI000C1D75A5|nr:uncharacterized protein LOC111404967 [Olea europaea var. sylvestris]
MEEDFDAENLEDGELWLPSDFFSMDDVQASTNFNSPLNYYSTSKPRCMEDLAQRFSDFNVRQRPNFSKSLQGFKPDQYRSTVSRPVACFGCSGGGGGTGSRWPGSSPVYPYQFLNPVQSLLHTFIEARPWTLQRQQNRFTPNRVLSIPGSGTAMGAQGGTGVFLPRTSANGSTTVTGRSPNNQYARSGHGVRSKLVVQLPRKNLIKREECHGYVAPVSLPNDWTY